MSLQDTAYKIALNVAAKASPLAKEELVKIVDLAEILNDHNTALQNIATTPTPPPGLEWLQAPVVEISGNMLDVSQGKLRNQGAQVTVPGISLTEPAVPAGQLQPYTLYADYSVIPAEFKAISNPAVGEDNSYAYPPVPAGGLWVGYFIMRELGFTAEPANPVLSVSINGGDPQVPGPTGLLNLDNIPLLDADNNFPGVNTFGQLRFVTPDTILEQWYPNESYPRLSVYQGSFLFTDGTPQNYIGLYKKANELKLETDKKLNALGGLQEDGVDLKDKYAPKFRPTKTITGNYTIVASDNWHNIKVNSASPIIITLPAGLAGMDIFFKQVGSGAFTFQAGASATVEQFDNKFTSAGQKATVSAYSDDANVWTIEGRLIA